jgi:hypothetical protein
MTDISAADLLGPDRIDDKRAVAVEEREERQTRRAAQALN